MNRPLVLLLYSEVWGLGPQPLPYPQIELFKNGKVNLLATFAGMTVGQMLPIRSDVKESRAVAEMRARARAAARKVKIRIKIEDWSMDTILVTSLDPQRKHKTKTTALSALLPRKRCFRPLPSTQPGPAATKPEPEPETEPGPTAAKPVSVAASESPWPTWELTKTIFD